MGAAHANPQRRIARISFTQLLGTDLDEELRIMACDEKANQIEELRSWIKKVGDLDNKR